jgi:hypothetical protein
MLPQVAILFLRNPIIGIVCCACGAIGHAAAALPMSVMNSRRLMGSPQAEDSTLPHRRKSRVVHHSNLATRLPQRVMERRSRREHFSSAAPQ